MPTAPDMNNGPAPEETQLAAQEAAAAQTAEETTAAAPAPEQAVAPEQKEPATPADLLNAPAEPEAPAYEYPKGASESEQLIIDVFKEKSIDPAVMAGIFDKAQQTGNTADIDRAKLIEAVGATQAALIMNSVQHIANTNAGKVAEAKAAAATAFGSEENFNKARDWALEKAKGDAAFSAKLDTYRSMLDAGGEQRRLALDALKAAYVADPGTKNSPELLRGQSTGGFEPIKNNAEYFKLLDAARRNRDVAEFQRIQNRWQMSQGR